jgi:FkbM family methyltransferase
MLSRLLVDLILARAATTARGRRWLEQQILAAQHYLGIGAGASVQASGERAVVDLLRQGAVAGGELCVFDVGSNQGQFLRLLLDGLAGLACRVHCFEPSPAAFARLQAGVNARAGGNPNLVLNPFGLGKAAGEFDLYSDAPGSGLASLSRRRLDHFGIPFGQRERIRLETLDAYCLGQGIARIDLLKIDVEGHELDVLQGGARLFAERRVRMVSFEFGGCNIDSRSFVQDFFYFFAAHGMRAMYRILPSGELHPVPGYAEALEQFRTTNFLVLLGDRAPLAATP